MHRGRWKLYNKKLPSNSYVLEKRIATDHAAKLSRTMRLPIGPEVVLFYGLYLESYKVIPKRNYLGAYGYLCTTMAYKSPLFRNIRL